MTAGGAPVWALLKPLGLLALLVALGVSAVNHVAGPWSQRLLREYTILVRSDLIGAGDPALALHRARAEAHHPHPRPGPERRPARPPAARRARSQAGGLLPRRAGADHQAGRRRVPAHGEGPHRAPRRRATRRRRSSPSPSTSSISTSWSSAPELAQLVRPPARALHDGAASGRRRRRSAAQAATADASPPSCTSASPARSTPSPSSSSCWPCRQRADHAAEPLQGPGRRLRAPALLCRMLGIAANNMVAVRPAVGLPDVRHSRGRRADRGASPPSGSIAPRPTPRPLAARRARSSTACAGAVRAACCARRPAAVAAAPGAGAPHADRHAHAAPVCGAGGSCSASSARSWCAPA